MKLDEKNLYRIQEILDEMVKDKFVSGVNALIIQDNKEIGYYESGMSDIEKNRKMSRDTIFRMYSMSKPMTAVGLMTLLQDGKIDLCSQVCWFLPGFENQMMLSEDGVVPVTKPVTIGNLLNMTSGLCYGNINNETELKTDALFAEIVEKMDGKEAMSTIEIANRLGQIPLMFEPGKYWRYGTSADVLGALIEVISGMSFGEYMTKKVWEPLGMKDTGFFVPEEKLDRLAQVYETQDGGLIPYYYSNLGISHDMKNKPKFESGGAGMVSTIDDYAIFNKMLLNNGTYNGVEILRPETVKFLTRGHLTDFQKTLEFNYWESLPGYSYGNLLRVMEDPGKAVSLSSKGEYGWDGWLGTYMFNDPANNLTFLMCHQKKDTGTTGYTRRIRNVIFSNLY